MAHQLSVESSHWGFAPRRPFARFAARLVLPIAGAISVATVWLAFYPLKDYSLIAVWSLFVMPIVIWGITESRSTRREELKARNQLLSWRLLVGWVTLLASLIIFAMGIILLPDSRLLTLKLWPIFVLPFVLIDLTLRTRHLTRIAVALGFLLGTGMFLYTFFVSEGNAVLSILPSLWLTAALLGAHFVYRRTWLYEASYRALLDIVDQVVSMLDPYTEASMQHLAEMIVRYLGYERAFIIKVIGKGDGRELHVRGAAGLGVNPERAKGIRFPVNVGITGRCVITGQPVIIPDVRKIDYFYPGGYRDTSAEAAFPISDGKEVVAVIDLQTRWRGGRLFPAFTEDDIETLKSLSMALRSAARLDIIRNYEAIDTIITQIEAVTEDKVEDTLIRLAREELDADKIIYYHLAPGTGYPLSPPRTFGLDHPEMVLDVSLDEQMNYCLPDLLTFVARWIDYFSPDVRHDQLFESQTNECSEFFFAQENVTSICFLRIGSSSARVGALLLGFTKPQPFSLTQQLALRTFAELVTPSLWQVLHLTPLYEKFSNPGQMIHRAKNRAGMPRGPIHEPLERAIVQIERGETTAEELHRYLDQLRQFWNALSFADDIASPAFLKGSLKTALRELGSSVVNVYGGHLDLGAIDSVIEYEGPDLKRVLYLIAAEAIDNAYIHGGNTRVVKVAISRLENGIALKIDDDGRGFDLKNHDESNHGIFQMLRSAQSLMGATFLWDGTSPGQGTHLIVEFPALPLTMLRSQQSGESNGVN